MASTKWSSTSDKATDDFELSEIDPKDLTCTFGQKDFIATGDFATVYRGQWKYMTVAVKQMRNTANYDSWEVKELLYEGKVVKELKHTNVIGIFGFYHPRGEDWSLVMEYAAGGTLKNVVKSHNMHDNSEMKLNKVHYQWAIQMAEGLEYIQAKTYAHRDLKSNNVLIKEPILSKVDVRGKTLKLADFGYAEKHFDKTKDSSRISDARTYQAPETEGKIYSPKSDVWSYGIIVHEILYGETPQEFKEKVPVFRTGFPAFFKDLLAGCWIVEPRERRYAIGHVLELLRSAVDLPDSPHGTSEEYSRSGRKCGAAGADDVPKSGLSRIQVRGDGQSLVERLKRNRGILVDGLRLISIKRITIDLRKAKNRYGKSIITQAEENAILSKSTDEDIARELLDVVINHKDEAVSQLISSLRSDQVGKDDLADLLEDPHDA